MEPSFVTMCVESWTSEGLSQKTISAYLHVLSRVDELLKARGATILDATASELRAISEHWPLTRASRMQLRVAVARAWDAAGITREGALAIQVPRKPHYGCRALDEPAAAILAASARRWHGPEGLAVMLAMYAGLRREEIASLRWSQIDLESGWMRIVGKGLVTSELPIHPRLLRRLAAWYLTCAPAKLHVFPGSRRREHVTPTTIWLWTRRVSKACLNLEIPPHVLRHTAIAAIHDRSGDLRVAQSFARHLSPETTQIYTRVKRERLARAVCELDYGGDGAA